MSFALKPDGGELVVCNFDSDSISIIETTTDEVSGSYLIGRHPTRMEWFQPTIHGFT